MATSQEIVHTDAALDERAVGDFSNEQLRALYRQMVLIRLFEENAFEQYSMGNVHGTMHLCIGQEATAVGSIATLRPDDQITSTHRGHGHAIAKGQDINTMMAELLGKEAGVCLGQGGSMHMADLSLGSLGANGIVAGGIPLSVGAGLSTKLQANDKVVLSYFGDGAVNNGNFHESLNMAAIWQLPVVFICENNQYAMSMSMTRSHAVQRVADRAAAYGIPGEAVDGMDVLAVYAATKRAVQRARSGEGPTLLELVTYRYRGHSKSDKQLYRTREEVQEWMERDGIARFRAWLLERDHATEAELDEIDRAAESELEAAIEWAHAQAEPPLSNLTKTVYAEDAEHAAAPARVPPAWIKRTFGPETPINPPPGEREITYAEALREAMDLALAHDEKVYLLGEDIGLYGGAFGVTTGLFEKFGGERVRDTPISENNIAGVAIGSSMTGMRAVAEMQFMDFVTLAMEQIVLQGAKIRYMFGGKASVPMVLRLPAGSGTGAAAQHSQSLEAWLVNVPGLKVVMPSTPYDAKGLLLAAIADDNPVMFVENKLLYKQKGPVPEGAYVVPLGLADVKRTGRDVTIVGTGILVSRALEAAAELAEQGIEAEVVDPRTLKPYDAEPIITSVKKTGRLIVAHEAPLVGGYGGELVAAIAQSDAFAYLDAPIVRLGGADVPPPYNRNLERAMVPQTPDIVAAVQGIVNYRI